MIQPDEDDYWQGLEGAATASPVSAAFPELQVRIIPEARPLIHALGNFDPRAIPEPLEAVLFAPDGPAADLPGEGGDRPADATRVFAVLDAAKLPYLLTAFIESSGMCQQSLFQGAAQRELGEYAPYLIELDRTNAFTRKLFTSVEQRGFWQAELGILIRARADFTAMRRHLRRFVRVRDDAGSWFYWRFWEGRRLAAALGALDGRDRVDFMMKGAIETIVVLTSDPAALQIGLAAPEPSPLNGARR